MLPANTAFIESECEANTLKQPHMSLVHLMLHVLSNIKSLNFTEFQNTNLI